MVLAQDAVIEALGSFATIANAPSEVVKRRTEHQMAAPRRYHLAAANANSQLACCCGPGS